MEKDYFGSPAYINGLGFRVKGERPKAVLEDADFSKSLLDELDEGEFYIDEFGIKRKRKKRATELQDINVEEISYVDSPATKKTFSIIKGLEGDDKEMDRCEWTSVQNCVFGFTEDDFSMVSESDIYEIEKSDPNDKFPTLTRQFNLNRAILEKRYEEYELESRLV